MKSMPEIEFPEQLDAEMVRNFEKLPHGSTRPHEGWIDGHHYVLKCGSYSDLSSDEHVHNEFVADELLRAAGFTVPVLAGRWQPTVASQQRVGKMGNVEFVDYAFSREVFEKAGGVIASTASPRATAAANGGTVDVICGRVEEMVADAVVNAANEHLAAGSGICGAIFRKAGYAPLQAACDKVAPCPTGEARITPAFGIKNAKYIIHAVGPRWFGGGKGEPALLANCYRNLLKTAVDNGCTSVAIPSISTGIFGYPLDAAIEIAVREVKAFVAAHPGFRVVFVVWDGDADGGKSTQAKYVRALGTVPAVVISGD